MFDLVGGEDRSITSSAAREVITLLYRVLSTQLVLLATGLEREEREESGKEVEEEEVAREVEAGLGTMAPYAAAIVAAALPSRSFSRSSSTC